MTPSAPRLIGRGLLILALAAPSAVFAEPCCRASAQPQTSLVQAQASCCPTSVCAISASRCAIEQGNRQIAMGVDTSRTFPHGLVKGVPALGQGVTARLVQATHRIAPLQNPSLNPQRAVSLPLRL